MRRSFVVGSLAVLALTTGSFVAVSVSAAPGVVTPAAPALVNEEPNPQRYELVAELSGAVHGRTEREARSQLASVIQQEGTKVGASVVRLDDTVSSEAPGRSTVTFNARAFSVRSALQSVARR